jgi:hypothetical protein
MYLTSLPDSMIVSLSINFYLYQGKGEIFLIRLTSADGILAKTAELGDHTHSSIQMPVPLRVLLSQEYQRLYRYIQMF